MVSQDHDLSMRRQCKLLTPTRPICTVSRKARAPKTFDSWRLLTSSFWKHHGTDHAEWRVTCSVTPTNVGGTVYAAWSVSRQIDFNRQTERLCKCKRCLRRTAEL
jgi:hypothetical protein